MGHPELAEAFASFCEARRSVMLEVLRRAVARGDPRSDIDLEAAADLLYGPIYYRLLITRRPLEQSLADRVVDAVVKGKGLFR
jgi:hypothetical protein